MRFKAFQDRIPPARKSAATVPRSSPQGDNTDVFSELLDIGDDIEDLRQVKDIGEELSIMSSLFHIQKEVLHVMDHTFKSENQLARQQEDISFETSSITPSLSPSSRPMTDVRERSFHYSPMLTAVYRNIEEVQRLEQFAERAARSVSNPLLVYTWIES